MRILDDCGDKFHKSEAMKKDCYDRNNARNRDVLTRQKSTGMLNYLEEIKEPAVDEETKMIEKIDKFRKKTR